MLVMVMVKAMYHHPQTRHRPAVMAVQETMLQEMLPLAKLMLPRLVAAVGAPFSA